MRNMVGLDTRIYNKDFYKELNKTTENSAEIIVPIVLKLLKNELNIQKPSVCDIGCGIGTWLNVFKNYGCKIKGFDGNQYEENRRISREEFEQVNLMNPYQSRERYDIAISLEVAEHIPEKHLMTYMKTLTGLSDIILFSAAIPYQMGQGHVNEQYPSYWIKKFADMDYSCIDIIREKIWNESTICHYYKQNILLMVRNTDKNRQFIMENQKEVLDLVHPDTWEKVQSWFPVKLLVWLYNNKYIYSVYQKIKKVTRKI